MLAYARGYLRPDPATPVLLRGDYGRQLRELSAVRAVQADYARDRGVLSSNAMLGLMLHRMGVPIDKAVFALEDAMRVELDTAYGVPVNATVESAKEKASKGAGRLVEVFGADKLAEMEARAAEYLARRVD